MSDISEALRELLLARAAGRIDAEEFERRQAALHAELLAEPALRKSHSYSWWPWLAGTVLVVGAAAGAIAWFGNRDAGVPSVPPAMLTRPMTMPGMPEKRGTGGDLKAMAGRLAEKLTRNPTDGEGWALLGQTYVELGQHKNADNAFAKAAALDKLDAKLLADWADAHVVANDRKWDEAARNIVKRALAADPGNLKALSLAGSEAFDRADYKQAIALWKQMRDAAPPGSMDAKLADANIEEATARLVRK